MKSDFKVISYKEERARFEAKGNGVVKEDLGKLRVSQGESPKSEV